MSCIISGRLPRARSPLVCTEDQCDSSTTSMTDSWANLVLLARSLPSQHSFLWISGLTVASFNVVVLARGRSRRDVTNLVFESGSSVNLDRDLCSRLIRLVVNFLQLHQKLINNFLILIVQLIVRAWILFLFSEWRRDLISLWYFLAALPCWLQALMMNCLWVLLEFLQQEISQLANQLQVLWISFWMIGLMELAEH